MDEIYMKCGACHLFVERNDEESIENGYAEYVHLHRGDEYDEALDETHEASKGIEATLDYWREHGPFEMRARFIRAERERHDSEQVRKAIRNDMIDIVLDLGGDVAGDAEYLRGQVELIAQFTGALTPDEHDDFDNAKINILHQIRGAGSYPQDAVDILNPLR